MAATLKTRKPVDQLKPSDFDVFPMWEFASDEEGDDDQDETWVRPVKGSAVRRGEYSQLVATDFTTKSGTKFSGYMTVTTADDPAEISIGALVGEKEYAVLPSVSRKEAARQQISWAITARDAVVKIFRASESDVFPISFRLRIPIHGEKAPRSGTIA